MIVKWLGSWFLDPDYWPAETAVLILKVLRNSNNYVISNFYLSNANIPAKPGERQMHEKLHLLASAKNYWRLLNCFPPETIFS